MGEDKTRFMRGDRYGIKVVAWHVAGLIRDLHDRMASFGGVRTEARDIPEWDDLVVERGVETTRWQVKRQTGALDVDPLKNIVMVVQSVLASAQPGTANLFHIAFRELVKVQVSRTKSRSGKTQALELTHLQDLCEDAAAPGMQANALVSDKKASYYYWWAELGSWLGTSDPATLQSIMKSIRITRLGDEAQLRSQALSYLTPFYDHPDQVFDGLVKFFTDYPDGRILVTPKILAEQVLASHQPRTGYPVWFDLRLGPSGTRWEVRSPRLLRDIAKYSWTDTSALDLTVSTAPIKNDEVTSQLTRLLLHSNATTTIRALNSTEWATHISQSCLGTLGIDSRLPNIGSAIHDVAAFPPMEDLVPKELADRLFSEMNTAVWSSLTSMLVTRVNDLAMEKSLRESVLQRWDAWYRMLSADAHLRLQFTIRLTSTEVELTHPQFESLARNGHQLVRNVADACVFALSIAEAFRRGGVDVKPELSGLSGNLILGEIHAHLLAVTFAHDWRMSQPCCISQSPYKALSREPSLLLLGGVATESHTLRRFWEEDGNVFSDVTNSTALDKDGTPLPLVTFSDSFKRALRDGIVPLQKHLHAVLAPIAADEHTALIAAIAGVTS